MVGLRRMLGVAGTGLFPAICSLVRLRFQMITRHPACGGGGLRPGRDPCSNQRSTAMTWPYVGSHVFVPGDAASGFALVGTENPGENESSARIVMHRVKESNLRSRFWRPPCFRNTYPTRCHLSHVCGSMPGNGLPSP